MLVLDELHLFSSHFGKNPDLSGHCLLLIVASSGFAPHKSLLDVN